MRKEKTVRQYYWQIGLFFLMLSFCGGIDFYYAYDQRFLEMAVDPLPMISLTHGSHFFVIIPLLLLTFFVLTRTIEKIIKQSALPWQSYILLGCFFFSLTAYITPPEITDILAPFIFGTLIPFALVILYWGIFYIRMGKNSTGIIRKKSLLIAFGLGFVFIGISVNIMLINIPLVIETTGYLFPFGFIVLGILGVPLLFLGFIKEA